MTKLDLKQRFSIKNAFSWRSAPRSIPRPCPRTGLGPGPRPGLGPGLAKPKIKGGSHLAATLAVLETLFGIICFLNSCNAAPIDTAQKAPPCHQQVKGSTPGTPSYRVLVRGLAPAAAGPTWGPGLLPEGIQEGKKRGGKEGRKGREEEGRKERQKERHEEGREGRKEGREEGRREGER